MDIEPSSLTLLSPPQSVTLSVDSNDIQLAILVDPASKEFVKCDICNHAIWLGVN
jgi:hypothetical protein